MQGYKTWVGIAMILLGWFGAADLVTEDQVAEVLDVVFQLIGMGITIYGNYKAHREIKALGGYRKQNW